jgi:hypothetical protein
MTLVKINLTRIVLPYVLVQSIINNKPKHVQTELKFTDPKYELIVNDQRYVAISRKNRFLRDSSTIDSYGDRGISDCEFIKLLEENPVKLYQKQNHIYEILDGMHRIERVIWLNLTAIIADIE